MDRVSFVQSELARAANPEKAGPMAAYMKTDDPFYGVQKAGRVAIYREMKRRYPIGDAAEYQQAVLELWQLPHREEKYLALGIATGCPEFITSDRLRALPAAHRRRGLVGLRGRDRRPGRRHRVAQRTARHDTADETVDR